MASYRRNDKKRESARKSVLGGFLYLLFEEKVVKISTMYCAYNTETMSPGRINIPRERSSENTKTFYVFSTFRL